MKRIKITPPDAIHARIVLPSSKSICNRALIMNALAKSPYQPENLSDCDDTRVMVRALQEMTPTIDIMAAGTAMRFLTAFLSVTSGTHVITGTERMQQRPIRILVDALRTLGADIDYAGNEGFPPLRITGTCLKNHEINLPGNVSSQYISALLMIGPVLEKGLKLTLTGDIVSRPYINLTLQMMHEFGAEAGWISDHCLEVKPVPYKPVPYYVESDWSASSYWYEICALTDEAEVELPGLFQQSFQGDSEVANLFRQLGVDTIYGDRTVTLKKTGKVTERMEYDFVNQPDLAQTFVVTCAMLGIPFHFYGLQSLKIKETDRINALITELKKLGYAIQEANDSELFWNGERCTPDAEPRIDTYEDHRMAMAFAPACIKLKELRINNPQVVSKSYPHYWENLQQAGFIVCTEED
ncbi:3-phosphoshikimate 1-carboxyvinyltransferase [uncultured Bacteroides sp.]|uniref:3-phosphoshikimate 1-carboxyvinyltransferase n=1 Tax=uncultured Bacteroides sp. TaxID=162156 RepID=UPI0026054F28|nr:3-phosphoshikimate 1-carboxyvinyltransferase [uncultured Bacteroides sp.]